MLGLLVQLLIINVNIMNTKEIINLMLKSSNTNPYSGKLSQKENIIAAIGLAKLCKEFADSGQTDEAMNINSDEWVVVILELEKKLDTLLKK
jgi:hypothetical protein